jgi:hypothetical protein
LEDYEIKVFLEKKHPLSWKACTTWSEK